MRLFLLLLVLSWTASGAEVVGIVDGDTIDAIIDGKQQRIRLAQIDAPERGQPFGSVAKQTLSDLAFKKDCVIKKTDKDRYDRIVGEVTCSGVNVNLEMVRRGQAWAYRKYLTDNRYLDVEAVAKKARQGLWSEASPIAPWEWRKMPKAEKERNR